MGIDYESRLQDKGFFGDGVNECTKHVELYRELLRLDVSEELKRVGVPYRILQGDTDIVASTAKVQRLVAEAANPQLSVEVVRNSGHQPSGEMMDAVMDNLVRMTQR